MISESTKRLLSRSLIVGVCLLLTLSMAGAGVAFTDSDGSTDPAQPSTSSPNTPESTTSLAESGLPSNFESFSSTSTTSSSPPDSPATDNTTTDNITSQGRSLPTHGINNPQAYYDSASNTTYVTFQGHNYYPYVMGYNHSTGRWSRPIKVGDNPLTDDNHGAPAIIKDSDGYFHVFYGSHVDATHHVRSQNPLKQSTWSEINTIGKYTTYPQVFTHNGTIFMFARNDGNNSQVWRSSDNGDSWTQRGGGNKLMSFESGDAIYTGDIAQRGSKFHFAFTVNEDSNTGTENRTHTYYTVFDNSTNNLTTADGTDLGETIDTSEKSSAKVTDTPSHQTVFVPRVELDGSGTPHLGFTEGDGADAGNYTAFHSEWDGSNWTDKTKITDVGESHNSPRLDVKSGNIVAYISEYGDMTEYGYDGSWSKERTIKEQFNNNSLSHPQVVRNGTDEFNLVYSELSLPASSTERASLFAHGESGEVTRGLAPHTYYSLNKESGPIVDEMGRQNGTFVGGTRGVSGEFNSTAVRFDGQPGVNISVGDTYLYHTQDFSIAGHFRTSNTSLQRIVSLQENGDDRPVIFVRVRDKDSDADMELELLIGDSASPTEKYYDANLADNETHSFLVSYDARKDNVKLFVDGDNDKTKTENTAAITNLTESGISNQNLHIGYEDSASGQAFDGVIDEVKWYSRNATEREAGNYDQYGVTNLNISGSTVSGMVTTKDGTPVSDATVKILGVDHSKLDVTDPDKIEERVDELYQQINDAKPDSWSPSLDVKTNESINSDGRYVAVTTGGIKGKSWFDSADLSDPQVQLDSGNSAILTVWNPSGEGVLSGIDEYDSQLPGVIDDDAKIVLEQLGPGDDTISTYTIETDESAGGGLGDPSAMEYVKIPLQEGFYRVYPEQNPGSAYVFAVGQPDEIFSGHVQDLRDQKGDLSQRASEIRDLLSQDKFQSTTVTTDENGYWSADVGYQVETVAITAYKGPLDRLEEDPKNVSLQDIRTLYEMTDITINDSVYTPDRPIRATPPESGIPVPTREVTAPAFMDMGKYDEMRELFRDWLNGELSYSDLPSFMQNRLSNATNEELQDLYSELDGLREENNELNDRVEEITGGDYNDADPGDLSNEELRNQVSALQQAMSELRESIDAGEPESSVGDNTVSVSFPFDTSLEPSQVMVLAHLSDGQTRTLDTDSEYVSVDSNMLGGSTVHVEDYPLGDENANLANFEVRVANGDGIGRSSESVRNPNYEGDVPGLDALSFNTLRPGSSNTVEMQIHASEQTNYRNLTSATVYGPDGSPVASDITDGQTVSFLTNGQGAHTIEATFATTDGESWTITERLQAGQADRNMPPGIRLSETPYGTVALTGDGFDGGRVDVESGGQSVTVTGRTAADGELPPKPVHIYTAGADVNSNADINVRLVKGTDNTNINRHKRVILHLPEMTDSSSGLLNSFSGKNTYWRNDQALPTGSSPQGEVREGSGGLVIETVTDEQGEVTISTNNNAGTWEYIQYRLDLWTQQLPNLGGFLSNVTLDFTGLGATTLPVSVMGVAAARRRRAH